MSRLGLDNKGFEEKSGLASTTISNLRCGRSCRLETATAAAKALETPLEELIEEW